MLESRSGPSLACQQARLALLALALLVLPPVSLAQVSPGPLATAHSDLEGVANCFKCHGARDDPMAEQCLDCHEGVARLRQAGRGLHGLPGDANCGGCHPEHAGKDFELIAWEEGGAEKFRHSRSGWPLEGKHAELGCRDCHRRDLQVDRVVGLLRKQDRVGSWMGLSPSCAACHDDPHTGALGGDCAKCHVGDSWQKTTPFDHQLARFPLEGRHIKVGCGECHLAARLKPRRDKNGRHLAVFRPVSHGECGECHQDPHQDRLGAACSTCHVPEGFAQIRERAFDHSRTRYPLEGLHRQVGCVKCHASSGESRRLPAYQRCADCHADQHRGELVSRGPRSDCVDCHAVEGWAPSSFDLARHQLTSYPLKGRHAELACAACHRAPSAEKGVRLRLDHAKCQSCHAEAHGDQLRSRDHAGACETCHTTAGFKPSSFARGEHAELSLSLVGAHATAACAACHGPVRPGLPPLPESAFLGTAGIALALGEISCTACHVDSHGGSSDAARPRAGWTKCQACHGLDSFRPAKIGEKKHAELGFPLEGAHRAISCAACHEELEQPRSESTLLLSADAVASLPFAQRRERCSECHRDPHGSQFSKRPDRGACGSCHGEDGFSPASKFNHETDAAFALGGAHVEVACNECHHSVIGPQGSRRVIYRPTPRECRDCHRAGRVGGET